jgi:hypothetical protein
MRFADGDRSRPLSFRLRLATLGAELRSVD